MNKLLTLFFISIASMSVAQTKDLIMSVPCDKSIDVFEILESNNEYLMFVGDTAVRETTTGRFFKAGMYIWINLEEKTSSVTIMFPDFTMCLLAAAVEFDTYRGKQPWDMIPKDNL